MVTTSDASLYACGLNGMVNQWHLTAVSHRLAVVNDASELSFGKLGRNWSATPFSCPDLTPALSEIEKGTKRCLDDGAGVAQTTGPDVASGQAIPQHLPAKVYEESLQKV